MMHGAALGVLVALCVTAVNAAPNFYPCVPGSVALPLPFCNTSLSMSTRIENLIGRMSLTDKCAQTDDKMGAMPSINWSGHNFNTEGLHGLGAQCLTINGTTRCPSVFAAPPLLGATFNTSVAHDLGITVSDEVRAFCNSNGHRGYQNRLIGVSAWHTNLNLYRDPRWGRNLEVPTEDPYVGGQYGAAYTRGLQEGDDPRYVKAIGALKHYTLYSVEQGRGSTFFEVATHDVEDSYLPAFRTAVIEGGALGYMCSYAALTNAELIPDSGVAGFPHSEPCCASELFAKRLMRDTYNFTGYVQSDCGAVNNEWNSEKWVSTKAEAAAKAINDGMMNSNCGGGLVDNVCDAIAVGLVNETTLDERITRSLTLLFRAGLFDPPASQPYAQIPFDTINSAEAQARNLEASRQGIVLLQNPGNVLPLTPGKRLALIGPHARTRVELAGNYFEQIGLGTCAGPDCIPSLEESLNVINGGNATVVEACADRSCASANITAAVAAVAQVDTVLLALGLDGTIEGEAHDRMDIRFPGQQLPLAQAVIAAATAAKKPVAVLLINGGMLALEDLRGAEVALLECWYPGATGGRSVAEAVFGVTNRFGKLPFTAYTYNFTLASDFVNMNMTDGPGRTYKYLKDPAHAVWPFGFGLSYTTFSLQILPNDTQETSIAVPTDDASGATALPLVRMNVTNTGSRAGDEVVFLFHNASAALQARAKRRVAAAAALGVAPPTPDPEALQQLVAYERVSLDPGQSVTVSFNLTLARLGVVDVRGTRHVLPGRHTLIATRGHGDTVTTAVNVDLGSGRSRVVLSRLLSEGEEIV